MSHSKTSSRFPVKKALLQGLAAGLPIGLGYFAVAFSLGIAARNVGLSWIQGFCYSVLMHASAGEFGIYSLIGAGTAALEVILMALVTNARYLLMSCALSQRLSPDTSTAHRLLVGFGITDEIFGVSVAQPAPLNPYYTYGSMLIAIPFWACGTALGILLGNILPGRLVDALSVALYGMFLAIIIPPAKKDRIILGLVAVSFLASWLLNGPARVLALFAEMSSGTVTIVLTVLISAAAALLFPRKEEAHE